MNAAGSNSTVVTTRRLLVTALAGTAFLLGCGSEVERLANDLRHAPTTREAMPIAQCQLAQLRTTRSREVLRALAAATPLGAFDEEHDILVAADPTDGHVYFAYHWDCVAESRVDDPTVVREALREAAPNVVTQSVAFDGVSSYDEIWRSACGEGGCNFFLKSGSGEVYRRIWFRWDHVGLLGLSLFDATPEEAAASRRGT